MADDADQQSFDMKLIVGRHHNGLHRGIGRMQLDVRLFFEIGFDGRYPPTTAAVGNIQGILFPFN